ncbi:MAG: sugar phosphate isomerase/epimerase family protein [Planctomycetota bacterium]|nr:sugar phosphate isomerase/epimerase family protein [Planctomycetota bacterium]
MSTPPVCRYGYNTNGFAHHDLDSVLKILDDIGYQALCLTPDVHHLNPEWTSIQDIREFRKKLIHHGMECVLETGARYLLNRTLKHEPTLLSPNHRKKRIEFLMRCVDWGAELDVRCVSFWSGVLPTGVEENKAWDWLVAGCQEVARRARERGVTIGFEPEPGMLVSTLEDYKMLSSRVNMDNFKLTLDVGHAWLEGIEPERALRQYFEDVVNVHIEDMRRPVHEHLFFGHGEIDFPPIISALMEFPHFPIVGVELSRHSHAAPTCAKDALSFLHQVEWGLLDS